MAEKPERRHFLEPNLGTTETARQHFIPRFYLAGFADDGRVAAYDLETGREFESSTDNLGVRTAFYDLEVAGGTLSTEGWLADIEGAAATIIRELVADPAALLALPDQDENVLSRFIAAQRFRVPSFRNFERQTRASMVAWAEELTRGWLQNTQTPDDADAIWQHWDNKPDWWWLQQRGPPHDAEVSTFMLGEVQGFANLVRTMSWRVGRVHPSLKIYTSDNPVSAYLPPVRPWWSGGALVEHLLFFPLSPEVLVKLEPVPYGTPLEPRGARSCDTFSIWETTLARHVITSEATRFLYGIGPYVPRECARSCLGRLNAAKLRDAIDLQGFDPNPPRVPVEEAGCQPPADQPDSGTEVG